MNFNFFIYFFTKAVDISFEGKEPDTVEIGIQGGIDAANGLQDSFKVYPVQMVAMTVGLKKEDSRSKPRYERSRRQGFSAFLDDAVRESCPKECHTVTYTPDSRLQTYTYHPSREYTF